MIIVVIVFRNNYKITEVHIGLAFGLIVATVVWCIAHVSGGHVNPVKNILRQVYSVRILFSSCQSGDRSIK